MKNFTKSLISSATNGVCDISYKLLPSVVILSGEVLKEEQIENIEASEFLDQLDANLSVFAESGKAYAKISYPEQKVIELNEENFENVLSEHFKALEILLAGWGSSLDDLDHALNDGGIIFSSTVFVDWLAKKGFSVFGSNEFFEFFLVTRGYAESNNLDFGNIKGSLLIGVLDQGDDISNLSFLEV